MKSGIYGTAHVHGTTWILIFGDGGRGTVTHFSGGSRIFQGWRRQLSGGVGVGGGKTKTYDFAKFFQKLHEIERIWTRLDPPQVADPGFS